MTSAAAQSNNSSVTLPPGTSNHGNPHLICFPAKWSDVAVFFVGNYAAHVATTVTSPGLPPLLTFRAILQTLLFPIIGISGGLDAIFSLAIFAPTDLQKAARAGALCCAVREDEYERSPLERRLMGDYDPKWLAAASKTQIHGRIDVPPGYCLAKVPRNARFLADDDDQSPITLCSQHSFVKILIAIGQLIFSVGTLYRARGDQIDRFGYAAFGLTVTQYALMSLINLLGNLICPQYPTMYLVDSGIAKEAAEVPGIIFDGAVGTLESDETESDMQHHPGAGGGNIWEREKYTARAIPCVPMDLVWILISSLPTATTVLVIWLLSRFEPGQSSQLQRALTMAWLGLGSLRGILGVRWENRPQGNLMGGTGLAFFAAQVFVDVVLGAVVVVAAWWVVAVEMRDFGICTRVA